MTIKKLRQSPNRSQRAIVSSVNLFLRIGLCLFVLSTFLRPAFAQAPISGQAVPSLAQLDTIMQQYMTQYSSPGATLSVSVDGRLVFARGYGYANTLTGEFVQPDSRMRLASNSKIITAVGILKLIEQGKLTLATTPFASILSDLTPPSGKTKDPRINSITIQNLLEHKAGYDDGSGYPFDPVNDYPTVTAAATAAGMTGQETTPVELISYELGVALQHDPGTTYAYSNLGYLTLGYIIERVTGTPYATWIEQNIFPTANMTQTLPAGNLLSQKLPYEVSYYGYPGEPTGPSMIPPVGVQVPYEYGALDLSLELANGGWTSTPMDLLRLWDTLNGQYSYNILSGPQTSRVAADVPPLGQGYYYTFYGSLPGTNSLVHLNTSSQVVGRVVYSAIFNTRDASTTQPQTDADNAIQAFVQTVKAWPTGDLFPTYATSGTACSFTLPTATASATTSGGSGSVSLTDANFCAWSASTTSTWIHLTGAGPFSDSGSVSYTTDANTGTARTGIITLGGQAFTISQAGTSPAVTLSASTLTFPSTPVSASSAPQTVTVTNTGTAPLTISNIAAISGANVFTQTNNCTSVSIGVNASCTITVTYSPITAGNTDTASVIITDNANPTSQTIALSGTAAAGPAPAVTLAPASLTFPSTQVNSTSAEQMSILTNSGTAALNITGITASAGFGQTNNCQASLAAKASCTITVTSTPTSLGAYSGTVNIADNASGSPQTIALSGTGAAYSAPTLTLSGTASLTYGQPETLTAMATGTQPSATYTWSVMDGATAIASGIAYTATLTYNIATPTAGNHSFTAVLVSSNASVYPGGTSNALAVTVAKASTTSSYAMPAAITYGVPLGAAQLNATSTTPGVFAYTPPAGTVLPAGTGNLSATLTPTDATDFSTSSANTTILVNKATLIAVAANATRPYGGANPAFAGTVTGLVNSDPITVTYTSTATATAAVGSTAPITPAFVDPSGRLVNYNATTTPATLTIVQAGSTLTLTAPGTVAVGASVTITATAASATTGTPTGTVAFISGNSTIGMMPLVNGVATLTVTLPSGSSAVTATYSGDTNYTGSNAPAITIVTGAPDFAISSPSATMTIAAGRTASFTLTATPANGFNSTITFACSGLPAKAACAFSPTTLTPAGGPVSTNLQISTFLVTQSKQTEPIVLRGVSGTVLALLFLPLLRLRRREGSRRLLTVLMILAMGGGVAVTLTGCASSDFSLTKYETPTGTYSVTVTASAGATTHTIPLSLIIQ